MKIGLIIPTYNRLSKLKLIIEDISKQKINREIILIPIVVIDGSTDGTVEFCNEKKIDYVLGNGNWWYTKSINEGCKYAISKFNLDFLFLTNDDIRIDNDFFSILIRDYCSLNSDKAILSALCVDESNCNIIIYAGSKRFSFYKMKTYRYFPPFYLTDEKLSGIKPNFDLIGRGFLIPKETWSELDEFDERFKQYGSDTEYGIRALRKKIPSYISWNAIIHENMYLTSNNKPYLKQTFFDFIKSGFNPISANYIFNGTKIIVKHSNKKFIIFLLMRNLFLFIYPYFKYKLKGLVRDS